MKKIYVETWNFHNKNAEGLKELIKFGNLNLTNVIGEADIIYSPNYPIETLTYPEKKFIFGPHFSVFPENNFLNINNQHKNIVYIQPSKNWACDVWLDILNNKNDIPILPAPFPVNVEKFSPSIKEKNNVFVYFKQRDINELNFAIEYLNSKNIKPIIIEYGRYNENQYLNILSCSRYGIWIGRHESQGFALQEALSCNVPLIVWDVKNMSQETNCPPNYFNIKTLVSAIPYWDKRCGEFFHNKNELEDKFNLFTNNIDNYKPREFILENLDTKNCYEKYWNQLF